LPSNLQLSTDLKFLERLLSELLHNACKYTPAGETIALAATLKSTGDCEIIVSNTGIEIAPAEQARIFDKFYRIPSSDPWKHEGTGLGLALVSRLADRLGGAVTLRSQHNLTEFIVTIPHLPPPPDP
jgi:signal transduction histidine kinase